MRNVERMDGIWQFRLRPDRALFSLEARLRSAKGCSGTKLKCSKLPFRQELDYFQ